MDNEKLNILRLLIEHQEPISIRQIALKRNINYKSAYNAVQKLNNESIITINPLGNTSLCTFNHNFNESVFIVEHARLQGLLKNKNFKVIHNDLKSINSQFIILLFGSYAKNTQTKHSDIDFLVIANEQKEIQNGLNRIPLNIHVTAITYADFQTMLKSKEFTVVSEAIKKNIILVGIEDYYRMINNAR